MTFPSQSQIDVIATQILLDAKQALLQLKAWNNSITDSASKLKLFKELVKATAAQMNGDFGAAASAVNRFSKALNVNPIMVKTIGKDLQNAGQAGKNMGDATTTAFGKVFNSVNALRIALGALISMILFNAIQAVQQLAADSVKQFTEMEDSLWRIVNVERELSKQGVEISVEGIKKGIEDIRKLLPIFSEQDISGLVGKVAISTKELGYTEKQILDLAKAISILNVRSTENEDLNQTASKVITALLSGTTKGVSGLGVQLNDTVIKAKAVEMGLLKATDSLDDLNKESKDLVKLQIILDGTSGELGNISEYLDTNAAKIKENSAAWDDFKAAVGGFTSTIIPAMSGLLEYLTGGVNAFKSLLIVTETIGDTFFKILEGFIKGKNAFDVIGNIVQAVKDIPKTFEQNAAEWIPRLFGKMPSNAPDWFKNAFGKYLTDVETATDETAKFKGELEDDENVLKALKAIDEGIQDIILDAQQAQENLDLKKEQKQQDIDTEYQRKAEDAARDHAQKLEDINRDAAQKIADAKSKARLDEKKAEEDLLQKLKELRDRYLLDLEEALHKRDARQILRLMKEYQLDKQHLLEKKKLDDKDRKDKLAEDLKAIEIERQRRIDAENLDYKRRLADLSLAKAREEQELQLWYKREQEDIQRNIKQKIEKLIAGYITEEKLHETEQAKIYAILAKYFGKDTALMGELTNFMAQQFAQIQNMAANIPAPVGSLNYQLGLPNLTNPFAGNLSVPGFAEGGTMIANRPTAVMFGEKGLEAATFTPLNRRGANVGKMFGEGGGGVNGQIVVVVDLSPDLEGRVVQKSMDGVAEIVDRVNRRKQ